MASSPENTTTFRLARAAARRVSDVIEIDLYRLVAVKTWPGD